VTAAFWLFYQFTQTLYQLHLAEGERDRWQRPGDVIAALNLKEGGIVAGVGCGVGYFSLKLAPKVAEHGSVRRKTFWLGRWRSCGSERSYIINSTFA
jgi:hypothetical protein